MEAWIWLWDVEVKIADWRWGVRQCEDSGADEVIGGWFTVLC